MNKRVPLYEGLVVECTTELVQDGHFIPVNKKYRIFDITGGDFIGIKNEYGGHYYIPPEKEFFNYFRVLNK